MNQDSSAISWNSSHKLSECLAGGGEGVCRRSDACCEHDRELAEARGVPVHEKCVSRPGHSKFTTPRELLDFVKRLREMCDAKPVGFKLCIGRRSEFLSICEAMFESEILPDYLVVDGGEGGTA